MLNKMLIGALLAGALMTPAAQARDWGRGDGAQIDQRRAELERRIDRGVRDGSLTRSETQRLRTGLNRIAYLEQRYQRSYGLSRDERRDLSYRLDRLSAQIQAERSDNQYRRG